MADEAGKGVVGELRAEPDRKWRTRPAGEWAGNGGGAGLEWRARPGRGVVVGEWRAERAGCGLA